MGKKKMIRYWIGVFLSFLIPVFFILAYCAEDEKISLEGLMRYLSTEKNSATIIVFIIPAAINIISCIVGLCSECGRFDIEEVALYSGIVKGARVRYSCYKREDIKKYLANRRDCIEIDSIYRKKEINRTRLLSIILLCIYLIILGVLFLPYVKEYSMLWTYYALCTVPFICSEICWQIVVGNHFCRKCWCQYCVKKTLSGSDTNVSRDYRDNRIGSIGSVNVYSRDWYTKKETTSWSRNLLMCPICGKEKWGRTRKYTNVSYH